MSPKKQHQKSTFKKFKLPFYGFMVAIYGCVALFGLGAYLNGSGQDLPLPLLVGVAACAVVFPIMLLSLYNHGGAEARMNYALDIVSAENLTELRDAGFEQEQFHHVQMMIYREIIGEGPEDAAKNAFIKEMHTQYDLRQLAEIIEATNNRRAS